MTKINVLDYGFVELVDSMGSDLTVVNSARVSFGKRKEVMDESDEKLINYLIKHKHESPLRHASLSFHCKVPEFVARQWYKHVVGINYTEAGGMREVDHAWNEISMRYLDASTFDYYVPEEFRKQSKSNKQCSTDEVVTEIPLELLEVYGLAGLSEYSRCYDEDGNVERYVATPEDVYYIALDTIKSAYEVLVKSGVAKEQARCLLPLNVYTEFYWTVSLQAIMNFIKLRDHEGSQYEIRQYAKALKTIVEEKFPVTMKAFLQNG